MMRKSLLTCCLLGLLAGSGAYAASYQGAYSPRNLRIDGNLNEAVYKTAPVIKNFSRSDGKKIIRPTECRIVFTPTAIVFGIKAYAPCKELKIPAEPTPRDRDSISCDAVDIMCDTTGTLDGYKHFIINISGGVLDRICEQGGYVGDEKWNGEWQSKVKVFDQYWTAEVSVPYRTMGITSENRQWRINLGRESHISAENTKENSSIINGLFNVSAKFASLEVPAQVNLIDFMVSADLPSAAASVSDGKNFVSIASVIRNLRNKPAELQVESLVVIPGAASLRRAQTIKLPPKGEMALKFDPVIVEKPGIYQGMLSLRSAATNRLLYRATYPVNAQFTPIKIALIDPHYRNAIFATQNLDKVRFNVKVAVDKKDLKGDVICGIKTLDGKVVVQKKLPAASDLALEFPVASLPDGKMNIFVQYQKETVLHPLRKLPRKAGEVWRGKDGNWYRDGKKLFINAAWVRRPDIDPNFNIIMSGDHSDPRYLLINPNPALGVRRIMADLKANKFSDAVKEFYTRKVKMSSEHPRLFAHFLCDEPDVCGFTQETFVKVSQLMADVDPYHPVWISPCSSGLIDFADSSELNGFHAYPRPSRTVRMSDFEKIVVNMDRANAYFAKTGRTVTITYLHQGFNYGDSGLANSKVPDYEEYRSQNIMALILGSKGLFHYNRGVENYPELYLGLPELIKLQKVVGNEAVIHDDTNDKLSAVTPGLRVMAKYNPITRQHWVMVCNTSRKTGKFSFTYQPFAGKKINLLDEKRSMNIAANGTVTDSCTPFEVHIYTTDMRDFKLKTPAEVNKIVADAYAARRAQNVGNLAYQENENLTVKVTASSNRWPIIHADNALWHIADGVTSGSCPSPGPLDVGIIPWHDNTPRKYPDWINMEFFKPVTVGRVEVYPVEDCLKDYEVQLRVNGKFVTVATVKDAKGLKQESKFAPQKCDAVRIFVTAGRQKYTRIYEVKVFEK